MSARFSTRGLLVAVGSLLLMVAQRDKRPARPAGNTVMEPGFLYQEAGHHDDKALPLPHAA